MVLGETSVSPEDQKFDDSVDIPIQIVEPQINTKYHEFHSQFEIYGPKTIF